MASIDAAIQPGDKNGNWWCLTSNGSMLSGSALTLAANGSPGVNPINLNGSTQWYESASGVSYPSGSFSVIVIGTFNSLPAFFDVLAQWTNTATSERWVLEGDNTGGLSFYVRDTPTTFQFLTFAGCLHAGQRMVMGASFNAATGEIKVYCNGLVQSAMSGITALQAATVSHAFGGRNGGVAGLFSNGNFDGAFFTEKLLTVQDWDRIGTEIPTVLYDPAVHADSLPSTEQMQSTTMTPADHSGSGAPSAIRPIVSNFTPALPGPIDPQATVSFDVTVSDGTPLAQCWLSVGFVGFENVEAVFDGYDFEPLYKAGSSVSPITNGFHFNLKRQGGFPANIKAKPRGVTMTGQVI